MADEWDNLRNWFNDPRTGDEWVKAVEADPIWKPPPPPPPAPPQNQGSPAPIVQNVPAPPPKPSVPVFVPESRRLSMVKEAPIDTIVFNDDSLQIQLISDLVFEDIGGTELINISRFDTIDGQEVIYAPIANLSYIRREFNPNNIVVNSSNDYFAKFGINLLLRGLTEPYFDDNGDLVIEIDTVLSEEEIQVQIVSNGTIDLVDTE